MNSTDCRIFVHLAELGSFKNTAEYFGVSRATVSKRLAALEKEFGAMLIRRSSRSVSLTQPGSILLAHCRRIRDEEDSAREAILDLATHPTGNLRLALPTPIGTKLMPALVNEFAKSYPSVRLSLHFIDRDTDVIGEGFDLVIKLTRKLEDSTLVAQRLATSRQVLVASPAYLRAHGTPADIAQLTQHKCLDFRRGLDLKRPWSFTDQKGFVDVNIRYAMTCNSYNALQQAACLGMGFIYVPELLVREDIDAGRLTVLFPDNSKAFEWGLFALYPNRKLSPKTIAMIGFVKSRISALGSSDGLAHLSKIRSRKVISNVISDTRLAAD